MEPVEERRRLPDSIDAKIRDLAKLIGYGLNLALHPGLRVEDLTALLE